MLPSRIFLLSATVGVLGQATALGLATWGEMPKTIWPRLVFGLGAFALVMAGMAQAHSKGRSTFLGAFFGLFSVFGLLLFGLVGARSRERKDEGWIPGDGELLKAAESGDLESVEARLAQGAPLDGRNREGRTALHVALEAGHAKVAARLIERGAGVDLRDRQGNSPLHLAAEMGSASLIESLLDRGAEIDARGNDGWTPLHCAAAWNAKSVVQTLVERGADLEAVNDKGLTPCRQAEFEQHPETADLLRSLARERQSGSAS
ncbi:MAG: ankyrin repeat domain-containing protein [Deltaproteobacteria bacterium]|nr:ankyrin repeat domain-containing protein [Deltaproteobacteria bacterium]